ncbi:uncharacterized protein F5147DRAFT_764084 [Suillus discolor]|uniref:Uncharacterized protein n=1 Tax=Suillus discolor TaxID=1912936 RepID=A0A9P7EVJ1_9AGAM|nr:uncharacterized protein F5147DRAFT_764084 [Suillus discolor]KAG2093159.1 hypothetical protein F5147DRAFT_764084 [Suillus discolor]
MTLYTKNWVLGKLPIRAQPRIPIKTSSIAENNAPIEKKDGLLLLVILPVTTQERFGFLDIGVRRPEFHHLLINTAQKHGVEIKWGHQAIEFKQSKDSVEVMFANGTKRHKEGCLEGLFTPDHQDFDEEINERLTRFFCETATSLRALSLIVSLSSGPYVLWRTQKCNKFFNISSSGPYRDLCDEHQIQSLNQWGGNRSDLYIISSHLFPHYGTHGGDSLQAAHKLGTGFRTVGHIQPSSGLGLIYGGTLET